MPYSQLLQSQPLGFFLSSANNGSNSGFAATGGFGSYSTSHYNTAPGQLSSSYKPNGLSHAIPTTNISMDLANSALFSSSPFRQESFRPPNENADFAQKGFQTFHSSSFQHDSRGRSLATSDRLMSATTTTQHTPTAQEQQLVTQAPGAHFPRILTDPDHYISYQEFLRGLAEKDVAAGENSQNPDSAYHEHLNIVDYPVNDLILMLSCLLSKIIEANDKLHPNHFDNTIAVRQKLKKEKQMRQLEKARRQQQVDDDAIPIDDENNSGDQNQAENDDFEDDNDDDEMKNKYLANVLAFHGTNVPGILLHAYLARVLKYCPVTNEVFLSLLVYFDRIAKKANNLQSKPSKKDDKEDSEVEQLFVMDSYNIHRLIISGITVSSKFFSDIFYKNLRYAKVGGLPLEELNYLELQFLLLLDFKLMISVEDLQNYGDLLLKFWKREEMAQELVGEGQGQDHGRGEGPL